MGSSKGHHNASQKGIINHLRKDILSTFLGPDTSLDRKKNFQSLEYSCGRPATVLIIKLIHPICIWVGVRNGSALDPQWLCPGSDQFASLAGTHI